MNESSVEKLVAVEGTSCAGKSTLLEALKPLGFSTIKEYFDYVLAAGKQFPNPNPATVTEAQDGLDWFWEFEEKRVKDAVKTNGTTILDRSVFTLLAFRYAIGQMNPSADIGQWSWDRLMKKMQDQPESIAFPDQIIVLEVSDETIAGRLEKDETRKNKDDFPYYNPEFNRHYRDFFHQLAEYFPGIVEFVDANRSSDQVLTDTLRLAGKPLLIDIINDEQAMAEHFPDIATNRKLMDQSLSSTSNSDLPTPENPQK